jgi:ATP-dependent RNA helicase DDX1
MPFSLQPSRELAEQTLSQIRLFKKHLGAPIVRELLVMGGVASGEQVAALRSGVDTVVATPGRLEELISTKEMSMRQCRFFVLDEADGLLKVRRLRSVLKDKAAKLFLLIFFWFFRQWFCVPRL